MEAYPEAITLKQLRAFREIVARRSLTAAAGALNLSVPAVHAQLRMLASHAGAELLVRDADGGWTPSAEGRAVLDAASAVNAALEVCARRVSALREGSAGTVALGVVSTAKYFAPALVARLMRQIPGVDIMLRVGNREETIEALAERRLDLAIMGRPPREPAVHAVPIGPHPHVIIAAPDHPLAGVGEVDPSRLLDETFLSREQGSGTRILMTRFLDRIGNGRVYRAIDVGTNETIKQMAMAGLGIALISAHTVTEELRQGRLVALPVQGLPIVRQWFLIHRSDVEPLPAAQTLFTAILAMGGAFLPS